MIIDYTADFLGAFLASWTVMNLFYIIINPLTRYKKSKTFLYAISYCLYVIIALYFVPYSIYYISTGLILLGWYIYKDKKVSPSN